MSSLYELTGEYQMLLEWASDPDADSQALADTMEAISDEIEEKAENYAKVIRTLEADSAALAAEKKRIESRKATIDGNIDRMKSALEESMKATKKTKFKTALFSFNIQKNPSSVYIEDGVKVPDDYLVEQDPKVDKVKLLKDLKAGVKVPGCSLKQTEGLRIR